MVVHQTVKPAVPGSNPASLQPAGTCVIPCWGASRVGMITAGWPLRGSRGKKIHKYQTNNNEKIYGTRLIDLKRFFWYLGSIHLQECFLAK